MEYIEHSLKIEFSVRIGWEPHFRHETLILFPGVYVFSMSVRRLRYRYGCYIRFKQPQTPPTVSTGTLVYG